MKSPPSKMLSKRHTLGSEMQMQIQSNIAMLAILAIHAEVMFPDDALECQSFHFELPNGQKILDSTLRLFDAGSAALVSMSEASFVGVGTGSLVWAGSPATGLSDVIGATGVTGGSAVLGDSAASEVGAWYSEVA